MFLAKPDGPKPTPPKNEQPKVTLGQVAWFYAGAWGEDRWVPVTTKGVMQPSKTINSDKLAVVGQIYKIIEPVNFREFPASSPEMSQSLGVLNSGTCVQAQEIVQMPQKNENNIWVWVRAKVTCLPSE